MKHSTLGGWLLGLSIGVIILLVLAVSDSDSFTALLGVVMILQIIFAIIGGLRLMKQGQ